VNRIVATGIATLLFCLTGATLSPAQEKCVRPRLISVGGVAEINVSPDQVVLKAGVESRDKDLTVARNQNDIRVKKIIALARKTGIEAKDIQTSNVRMSPDFSEEKVPRFLAYEVSQSIVITLKDISKYEMLVTQLLEGGLNRLDGIDFQVSQTRKYRDEARLQAVRAAKEKATAMAGELGQTLGKPWEINEESSRPSYGVNANYSGANVPRMDEGDSTIAPGQVTIRAQVTVSFELQ
jgi:uncharacterized protein YggE